MSLRDRSAFARGFLAGAVAVVAFVVSVIKFLELMIRAAG